MSDLAIRQGVKYVKSRRHDGCPLSQDEIVRLRMSMSWIIERLLNHEDAHHTAEIDLKQWPVLLTDTSSEKVLGQLVSLPPEGVTISRSASRMADDLIETILVLAEVASYLPE